MSEKDCNGRSPAWPSFPMLTRPQRLFGAVLFFILLDLTILLINYQIAYQVSRDAVAINLAGRQRMLSQRMTKALLQLEHPEYGDPATAEQEFRAAMLAFDQTLDAFDRGGAAAGGSNELVILQAVHGPSVPLVKQALQVWQPIHDALLPYVSARSPIPPAKLAEARDLMLQRNLKLLELMNSLTSKLEQDSRDRADTLRTTQTVIFLLALLNFVGIVRGFHLLARQATQNSQRFDELARRDPLTGLFNRRQFGEVLEREANTARRHHDGFALLMIDLDNFKPINDLHGHAAGDTVLRTIAARLTSHARTHDTIARIGGDEFVLICPDLCSEQAAADLCERLLTSINEAIDVSTGSVTVGASIGIAFFPVNGDKVEEVICEADKAMYQAKHTGRNNWVFAADS